MKNVSHAGLRVLGVLAMVALTATCRTAPTTDVPGGPWIVTSYHAPGVSAMQSSEAEDWIGVSGRFGQDSAIFGDYRCDDPTYEWGRYGEEDFLTGFRISKASLQIAADEVAAIEVLCKGAPWAAPGSFLILDDDRLFTVWDGVFFELEQRSHIP